MNTEAIMPAQIIKNAKTVLDVGQKQWKEAVSIYKTHGKQFLNDGKQIVSDSKALYQDLWDLQMESVSKIKKAFLESLDEEPVKRAGASKKNPRQKAKKVETEATATE